MSVGGIKSGSNTQYQEDVTTSLNLGKKYKEAEDALEKAVLGGDKGEILAAQKKFDKMDEAYNLLSAMLKKSHDTIMAIIRNISQ